MQPPSMRIDPWKVEVVRKYLERMFAGGRFDDYPRGSNTAHLFIVTELGFTQQQKRHYLLITRQFFDRFTDQGALRDGLDTAEVAKSLERAGDRTVELY